MATRHPGRSGDGGGGWAALGMGGVITALGLTAAARAAEVPVPVPSRTQTVELRRGWNAVFLEVDPANPDPAVVFADSPVDVAAAHIAPVSSAQFVSNPDADLLKKSGWNVWYSATRPDAVLTTLHAVQGQQPYLLHATEDYVWKPTGAVMMAGVRWEADAYSLVGFSVSATSPPTFAQFFEGSPAHRHNRIYRMVEGTWRQVTDPSAQTMRSGEAFWMYCDGSSRYRGPLSVDATIGRGLVLGVRGGALVLRNVSGHPVTPTLADVSTGPGSLPVSMVVRAIGDPRTPIQSREVSPSRVGWVQPLPTLEAGGSLRIPMAARREAMSEHVQTAILRLSTDLGTETWVPVVGVREDLKSH